MSNQAASGHLQAHLQFKVASFLQKVSKLTCCPHGQRRNRSQQCREEELETLSKVTEMLAGPSRSITFPCQSRKYGEESHSFKKEPSIALQRKKQLAKKI